MQYINRTVLDLAAMFFLDNELARRPDDPPFLKVRIVFYEGGFIYILDQEVLYCEYYANIMTYE